ncbi:bifunctional methylenetetrahydrofolate dehydrogenase/methenyltetrahydrofolate cyclohydrolase FolD [Nitratidesulfovibrio vulgaris]|jgi:methylenetetrahydrofolate dehydrogenase (NADP+)/methenyltetrahydrofolate cyclohydrolase|uniref:Bifunctional protein FolD n=2 Tax=Nitratidesulfovibrio vulgaris TaxID=881 RepID=FOLD_NITV2|nr:bifunctional methylenetetrahydrofolate dehydrogenase/methenyltetrahydrofolate cyclohydrolase FolD [Nitratidesulfovibrio vulgaris]A1VGV4.1 RecName: Full=Bifunctional protein FolD; Includes: RecName: Full=Methylenetetrahydrofolate dehydrogenase; Includes: RecName: Full=Methenyltetrahydrofolate cyclohydrolase [Nitratidesulfovibrio vulgaris DP4]Q72F91.1 RecName: Full=Bifunctional protein FolD; Includes: RecName: Full=Methylenetetrahydrofolate dehydrogenase; Includes: RecName: Full=Methenyltetrahyd
MQLLDGKATAATIREELRAEIAALTPRARRAPGLAVILVGEDPASQVYVRNKERACHDTGIVSEAFRLAPTTTQEELERLIADLNVRPDIDGILLQLPLPRGLDAQRCLEAIDPAKDVDGFHPQNMGRLALGLPGFRPCTPAGVMTLLERYDLSPSGRKAVVVGRSNIVGKPLALMLGAPGKYANATVTVCHSGTPDLAAECRTADFLFLAIGRPRFVTADMVREGAVVVDVGINRTETGLAGDCDFEGVSRVASAITPVPGGVGPMTIAQLLVNTVQSWKVRCGL